MADGFRFGLRFLVVVDVSRVGFNEVEVEDSC